MKFLIGLLLSFLFAFSIPVIVVEKELVRESSVSKTHRKVKLYIAKGYEKEEIEEEGVHVSPLPGGFLRMQGMPRKTRYRMRAERLIHFKRGKAVFYSPNKEEKSYTEEVLTGSAAVLEFLEQLACNGVRSCKLKVEPTDEWRELSGWKARRIILKAVSPNGEFTLSGWYTKDSELLLEATKVHLENLMTAAGDGLEKDPPLKGIVEVLWDVFRNYGVPVMEESSDEITTTREVVRSVRKVDLPESFFRVPEDYRKVGR